MQRIVLGITLGDLNGIGPEVAVKAALGHRWPAHLSLALTGSRRIVRQECRAAGFPTPPAWAPGTPPPARVVVWDAVPSLDPRRTPGLCRADAARAAVAWIRSAVSAAMSRSLDGMVTAPINKEGLHRAGIDVPGHTELLADLTRRRVAMMLMGGALRVVLVTRHVSLARVPSLITAAAIEEAVGMTAQALGWLGIRSRAIAVCALNPHAGDGGVLGREEQAVIRPAIRRLQRRGLPVEGPVPADVVFYYALHGRYGAVVSMYHDQGLGPLKMLAFDRGVNLTLGLPIVRTSPDHGTAYDIAGRGKADPSSMVEAIRLAARLAHRPNPWE